MLWLQFITDVNIWCSCKSTSLYVSIGSRKKNFIFKQQRFETRNGVYNMESVRQTKEQCTLKNNFLNNEL